MNKNKKLTLEGKFIVIEGTDGSGKSTQITLLREKIEKENLSIHTTQEPTERPIGKLIRQVLAHKFSTTNDVLAGLYFSDRLDHLTNDEDGILQHLANGTSVIADRYYLSSLAYNSLNSTIEWVYHLNEKCMNLRRPDLTIFLDLEVGESLRRIQQGRETIDLFEKEDVLTQIKKNYLLAIDMLSPNERIIKIDASKDPELIHAEIWELVDNIIKSKI
ncbi:MAG: dTMP kinase [Saprospiraceae bacterium]